MKKQNGFTLIELVVVIVILGILAVTAAPKFLNLQDDAKISAVKGLTGAMKGAAGITYGKAAVQGVEALAASSVAVPSVSGGVVTTIYGYPDDTATGIELVVDGLDTDWVQDPMSTGNSATYGYAGFDCYAVYTEATSTVPATATISGAHANCSFNN